MDRNVLIVVAIIFGVFFGIFTWSEVPVAITEDEVLAAVNDAIAETNLEVDKDGSSAGSQQIDREFGSAAIEAAQVLGIRLFYNVVHLYRLRAAAIADPVQVAQTARSAASRSGDAGHGIGGGQTPSNSSLARGRTFVIETTEKR